MTSKTTEPVLFRRSAPARCEWFWITKASMPRGGRRCSRLPRRSAARRRRCMNGWQKAERDSGARAGVPTDVAPKLKALERENRELRQANEILRKASAYFDGVDAPARRHCNVSLADPLRATRRSDIHASSCDYRR